MRETRTERAEGPLVPATAARKGLGCLLVGSAASRAVARALAKARQESEAEDIWDKPLGSDGLAERMRAARQRAQRGGALQQWTPIHIPPGKENTVRGQLAARLNAAKERLRQYEAG